MARLRQIFLSPALHIIQILVYLLTLFVWFEDSFSFSRKINLPLSLPLSILLALTILRLCFRIRPKRIRLRLKLNKTLAVFLILMLAATVVRIPFFMNSFGLMDSDKAVSALMGKHIAQGKQPPLNYYGALYQGSLIQHFQALVFKIFGYSILAFQLSAYFFFLLFLCLQFLLLKEIFSFEFAAAAGFFYALPFKNLVLASFDDGSGFPLIFFLGGLILYLTHQVCFKNKLQRLPALGFLMGLSFWSHNISFIFILTSLFFLILVFRLQVIKYLRLLAYFLTGAFPVLILDASEGFVLFKFLFLGEGNGVQPGKIGRAKTLLLSLFAPDTPWLDFFYLALLGAGVLIIAYSSLQAKKLQPSSLFVVYFILFSAVYLLSEFSQIQAVRYLFILYLALPVLLSVFVLVLRPRWKYPALAVFFLLIFLASNLKDAFSFHSQVQRNHLQFKEAVSALLATGEKYWMGEYWTSYLVNALSAEKLIVASYSVERYFPYYLLYFNCSKKSNWIFSTEVPTQTNPATRFCQQLEMFRIPHHKKKAGRYLLVSGIESEVFPRTVFAPVPKSIPRVRLSRLDYSETELEVHFENLDPENPESFRLVLEIPSFSRRTIPLPGKDRFSVAIPRPGRKEFNLRHYLDYKGLAIKATEAEALCSATGEITLEKDPREVDYLTGFGPQQKISGTSLTLCSKEARLRINRLLQDSSQISLYLHSPFLFSHPFWYGRHCQQVSVYVNGIYAKKITMTDGKNIMEIDCFFPPFKKGENDLTLKFRYASAISAEDLWKTAAYLEKVVID